MDRLKHRYLTWMDVGRWRQPESALNRGAKIAEDVAEHVARHNYLELARVPDHLHGEGVDVEVTRFDLGVPLAKLSERSLPQTVSEGERVRLVAHADLLQAVSARVLEGVNENPLHAFARIDVLLHCDLVSRILLENAAHADVKPFGVLAEDNKVHVLLCSIHKR